MDTIWTPERVIEARAISTLIGPTAAAEELSKRWGEHVTKDVIVNKLRRERMRAARTVPAVGVKAGPVPPTGAPASFLDDLSDDDKTKLIQDLIPQAAKASQVQPSDCNWYDFLAYAKIAWGENSCGIAKRHITRVGGYNRIRDAAYPVEATEYALERAELQERAAANRHEARREVAQGRYLQQLRETCREAFADLAAAVPVEGNARKVATHEGERTVSLLLSDLHHDPQSRIVGFDEAGQCRRLAKITDQFLSYKPQYKAKTDGHIFINGDLINNWLHGVEGAHPMRQAVSAADKLVQIVALAAARFNRLTVDFAPGNHDRDMFTDPKRALEGKEDGHILTIWHAVQTWVEARGVKNVTVNAPRPEVYFNHYGIEGMAAHGDTIFGKVTPKTLSTDEVEYTINAFNASRGGLGAVKLVLLGHWHSGMVRHLDNGVTVAINGSLVPVSEHARSLDIFEANCGQWIFESVPGHIWGDARFIRVGQAESKDSSLDGMIRPFALAQAA